MPSATHELSAEPCSYSDLPGAVDEADSDEDSVHDPGWHDRYYDEADSYKNLVSAVVEMRDCEPVRKVAKFDGPPLRPLLCLAKEIYA